MGFRYTVSDIAKRLRVSGWVKNTPDGKVELVAEGDEPKLKQVLTDIKGAMNYTGFKEQASWMPATGEFKGFAIKYF